MACPAQFSPVPSFPSPGSSPLGSKINLNSKCLSSQLSFPCSLVLKTQNDPFLLDTPIFFPASSSSPLYHSSGSSTGVTNVLISEISPDWLSHWKVVLGRVQCCLDSVCPLCIWSYRGFVYLLTWFCSDCIIWAPLWWLFIGIARISEAGAITWAWNSLC